MMIKDVVSVGEGKFRSKLPQSARDQLANFYSNKSIPHEFFTKYSSQVMDQAE